MSGLASIAVGDQIPISLFLQGMESDLYPIAIIRQADGTLIDVVDLTHVVNGVYRDTGPAILMPDTEFVTVLFTVYTDALWTIESLRYQPVVDTFAALLKPIRAKTDQLNFTVADHVDVNLRYHNDAKEYGTGTPGDPWRGYP